MRSSGLAEGLEANARKRNVPSGSISTELGLPRHVRSFSDSDRVADIMDKQLRAGFIAKVGCCRWAVGHFVKSGRL